MIKGGWVVHGLMFHVFDSYGRLGGTWNNLRDIYVWNTRTRMHDRDVRVLPLTTRDAREKLVVIMSTICT